MKCSHCGFVSNKDFYVCPYCGETFQPDNNVLRKIINIGGIFSISVRALIYVIVLNILGLALLVDWYLEFRLGLILWTSIVAVGIIAFVSIKSNKSNPISRLEKIIFFVLFVLILCVPLCRIVPLGASNPIFDWRQYFPTFVIPIYIISSIVILIIEFLVNGRHQKIRPIWTEGLIILLLIVASLDFIFLLVNKNYEGSFWMFQDIYPVSEILVFIAFGMSLVFAINYNIIITGHIVRKVKNAYGQRASQ